VLASHLGAWLSLPGCGPVRVSPRDLLHVYDQPEKRAVKCLKGTGCLFPCTFCMVGREESCSASGADAPSRDVQEAVRAQLKKATMGAFRGAAVRRAELEMEHSINSVVPPMAAWAGLGNGPRTLYRLPCFDRLHVRLFARQEYNCSLLTFGGRSGAHVGRLSICMPPWSCSVLSHQARPETWCK